MSLTRLISWPRRCLSRPGRAKSLGSTPLSEGLSRSMAVIASSTRVPIVGCGALAFRCDQRASFGTQKMLAARYSSGSSGSAPAARSASSSACFASKASLMYLRKIRPRTTCLYSAASMLLRRASAVCQSFASKPPWPAVPLPRSALPTFRTRPLSPLPRHPLELARSDVGWTLTVWVAVGRPKAVPRAGGGDVTRRGGRVEHCRSDPPIAVASRPTIGRTPDQHCRDRRTGSCPTAILWRGAPGGPPATWRPNLDLAQPPSRSAMPGIERDDLLERAPGRREPAESQLGQPLEVSALGAVPPPEIVLEQKERRQ